MPDPNSEVLNELGRAEVRVALVREHRPENARRTELGWWQASARRVAEDIETPAALVGVIAPRPIRVSGVERFLEKRVTILEAIDVHGPGHADELRASLRALREGDNTPEEVRRRVELWGKAADVMPIRPPESVTEDEGRLGAAVAILRHSLNALLLSPLDWDFHTELEQAAAIHPRATVELLVEEALKARGWPD